MGIERMTPVALHFTTGKLDSATETSAKTRLLGAGGFGSVFRHGGTDIAVKCLDMVSGVAYKIVSLTFHMPLILKFLCFIYTQPGLETTTDNHPLITVH